MGDNIPFLDYIKHGLESGDVTVIGIIVALIIGVFSFFILIVRSSGKSKKQGVLLLGLCDAGKTVIYSQLVHKAFKQTYTSIQVNAGDYVIPEKNKKLRIFDLPGHERLRNMLLDEYKNLARGIIYVVDSGTLQKDIKEVAEFLYAVLTVSAAAPPILILCNKQDLTLSKGAKVIRSQLEKEINTLRVTRSAALKGVGDTANNNTYLGKRDKDFDFSDLKSLKIEFAESSAVSKENSEPQLAELCDWLARLA